MESNRFLLTLISCIHCRESLPSCTISIVAESMSDSAHCGRTYDEVEVACGVRFRATAGFDTRADCVLHLPSTKGAVGHAVAFSRTEDGGAIVYDGRLGYVLSASSV